MSVDLTKKYANLGCGSRYHAEWWNCDFTPKSHHIQKCDLSKGIPQSSNIFDVVYHSHVLEHFDRTSGVAFLSECLRILKPNGILRVAVPDLEGIAKAYLQSLLEVDRGSESAKENHSWMIIELIDQLVREHSGGEMAKYLRATALPNKNFVLNRLGQEAKSIMESNKILSHIHSNGEFAPKKPGSVRRLASSIKRLIQRSATMLQRPPAAKDFRQTGEVHKWMYDRVSLQETLTSVGFVDVTRESHNTSAIPNWTSYLLDTMESGIAYKPDSLYMEARKPRSLSAN